LSFQYGRKPPHPNETHPRVYLDDFFRTPVIPQTVSYGETVSYPMDLNDRLGDCGIAGMDHMQMCWCSASGQPVKTWGNPKCESLYETLGGYVPGDPNTDQGTVLQDNLKYWEQTGVNGNKITQFGALRKWDKATRLQALYYFGPLYVGINCPASAQDQFPGPWTYVPGSPIEGGHCIVDIAEDAGLDEIRVVSWGKVVHASEQFFMAYTEEVWVAIDPDFLSLQSGRSPEGIDVAGMEAELAALSG
jgi:hypothetical protein